MPREGVSFVTSGFCLSVCLSVTPHFFKFPNAICVEGYLRGRNPLRLSCTLKMGTMKARVEVRHYTVALHAMYETVHRALINRYTHTVRTVVPYDFNHDLDHRRCSQRSLSLLLSRNCQQRFQTTKWTGSLSRKPIQTLASITAVYYKW